MYKIGEFSQLGQVSARMLRHYDKLGLLQPSHTDSRTGYRYYTIDQLAQLHRIIALKELGLSLSQIGDLLAGGGQPPVEQLRGMLVLKEAELRRELDDGQMRLQRIAARLDQIEHEGRPSPYEIVLKPLASFTVASLTTTVPHIMEMDYYCASLTRQVSRALVAAGITPLSPELILYHTNEYKEENVEVEAAIALAPEFLRAGPLDDRVDMRQLPGHDLAAALIFAGPRRDLLPAVLELLGWVARNRHCPVGPLREVHLSGPAHEPMIADSEAITELQIPIAADPSPAPAASL